MKYEINIHVLRCIARYIGVKAPTLFNKKVLIDEIMQIQSGKKQPCSPSKKGRPPKYNIKNRKKLLEENIINLEKKETSIDKEIKKEIISNILKEIEEKLNKIL